MKLVQLNFHHVDELVTRINALNLSGNLVGAVTDGPYACALVNVTEQHAKRLANEPAAQRAINFNKTKEQINAQA